MPRHLSEISKQCQAPPRRSAIRRVVLNIKTVTAPPLRVLIVDDEPIARQVLREELETFPAVEIVGEAASGAEALCEIAALRPDLVLLDLEMPGLGGFDVIHRLPAGSLPVIVIVTAYGVAVVRGDDHDDGQRAGGEAVDDVIVIVTAYDRHAIRAFDAGALDYLLKPVSRERLERALDRARTLRGKTAEVAESLARWNEVRLDGAAPPRTRKIVGRAGEEYFLIDVDEVLAFQAEREIVWIVTARQRYMATAPLHQIESRLAGSTFQRVHRNALVNVNHVRKLAPLSSQRWLLTLTNGQELIVSKRLASRVREMLRW